ncbi:MAG TPA: alpha/beta hydrolase [Gammaproteobacteria bacterium]
MLKLIVAVAVGYALIAAGLYLFQHRLLYLPGVPGRAAELYPWLPARWLSRFEYPTRRYVAAARCPVLVVHSRDDEITPYRHAEAIFASARDARGLVELTGTHNDAHVRSERTYVAALRAFLADLDDARPGATEGGA